MKISLVASNKNSWNVFLNKGLGFFRYPYKACNCRKSFGACDLCKHQREHNWPLNNFKKAYLICYFFCLFPICSFFDDFEKSPIWVKTVFVFSWIKGIFLVTAIFFFEHRVIRHSFDVFGKFLVKCERARFLSFLLLLNTCGSCLFAILLGSRSGRVRFTCVICALLTRRK